MLYIKGQNKNIGKLLDLFRFDLLLVITNENTLLFRIALNKQ